MCECFSLTTFRILLPFSTDFFTISNSFSGRSYKTFISISGEFNIANKNNSLELLADYCLKSNDLKQNWRMWLSWDLTNGYNFLLRKPFKLFDTNCILTIQNQLNQKKKKSILDADTLWDLSLVTGLVTHKMWSIQTMFHWRMYMRIFRTKSIKTLNN